MMGKYNGTTLHKKHLFARDTQAIVCAFTFTRDEHKRLEDKQPNNNSKYCCEHATSTVHKVLVKTLSEGDL